MRVLASWYLALAVIRLGAAPADFELTTNLHRFIILRSPSVTEVAMSAYTNTMPGTNVSYRMTPIPGGEFLIGSPESEMGATRMKGHNATVRIEPFWMGVCEVTWNEYEVFQQRTRLAARASAGGFPQSLQQHIWPMPCPCQSIPTLIRAWGWAAQVTLPSI